MSARNIIRTSMKDIEPYIVPTEETSTVTLLKKNSNRSEKVLSVSNVLK